MSEKEPSGGLGKPHDLYVAFAFAAADLLVEIDAGGRIEFAVGASMALIGWPARKLSGMLMVDLIIPADQPRLTGILSRMGKGSRVRNDILRVTRPEGGKPVPVMVSGYRHPDKHDRLLLALGHPAGHNPGQDKRTGPAAVLDKDSFRALASDLLNASTGGDDPYKLTMVDLPQIEAIRAQAGSEAADAFTADLGNRLKELSAGGDAVGQLADNRLGVLHAAGIDTAAIGQAVTDAARATAPTVRVMDPVLSTMTLDVGDLPPEEAAQALIYTLNAFAKSEGPRDLATLTASLQPKLSATVKQMREVRATVEGGNFKMMFQPIVDLRTSVVHHFECLVRFDAEGGRSPYETVSFAEDTGLVGKLDLAVVERVLAAMRSGPAADPSLAFAVNLSGRSFSDAAAMRRLRHLLKTAGDLRKRLLFEVTESAEIHDLPAVNAVIQEIRSTGHHVCLDDFGAGSAAFHYLRALKVDNVKIDGSYIKDMMQTNENISFIKAIVQLCGELGIATTAEYVENSETANMLRVLKVRFGQGYLYGKPYIPAEGRGRAGWVTPTIEWRQGLLHFKG